jgi:alpha-beta hydrolase superfamily lysophospholipase
MDEMRHSPQAFPNVSARWLLTAVAITLLGIAVCAWLSLCLLYWQGSWQLLYHPKAAVTRTPASAGLAYEPIRFAVTETGIPQLTGWWIPAEGSRFTLLYLHGADGNLSDTVDMLAALHRAGLTVFAIDYRGYGQSQATHPSEASWLNDANRALDYLTQSRHIPAASIVLYGEGLGANLAANIAGQEVDGYKGTRPKIVKAAGVILANPKLDPVAVVFSDSRSNLVPAHLLVRDRYDLTAAAQTLVTPSLWLIPQEKSATPAHLPQAYQAVTAPKMSAVLRTPIESDPNFQAEMQRWLDDLASRPPRI